LKNGRKLTLTKEHLQWATTDLQRQRLEMILELGSVKKAAEKLRCTPAALSNIIQVVKERAATKGYAPAANMVHATVDPFIVKGTSTLFNADGDITAQWVKTTIDPLKLEEIKVAAIEALKEEIPRLDPLPQQAPYGKIYENLATVYTLTDSHVGALCWHKEGGDDWDLQIAEKVLTDSFMELLSASPSSRVGIVAQLGDFLHQDSILPVTPTNGHILDSDGRFSKVIKVAIRILRRVVDAALAKHEKVVVLMAEGNHDITSSIWLRAMFAALYENEPRIEVIDSELPYYVYQHGSTMLAWHHGHLKKNDQLPMLFAAQFPKIWGNTTKRYVHCGHRHHVEEKEHSGMKVIQHSTLAARDAYAARGGWTSERQALAITYHAEYGEVSRVTVTPEMVK
jgi:hypothetical protein